MIQISNMKMVQMQASQFFHKIISTHLLTVLTISVITAIEQKRRAGTEIRTIKEKKWRKKSC